MGRKKLEIKSGDGKKGIFVTEGSSGLVIGPISVPSVNDHVTVALMPSGDLRNIHRKTDLKEVWRHTPASLETEYRAYLSKNLIKLEWSELEGPRTYVVSLYRRVKPWLIPFGKIVALSVPFLAHLAVYHDEKKETYRVDTTRLMHVVDSLSKSPISLIPRISGKAPGAGVPFVKLLARFFLRSPKDRHKIYEDICFLLSPNRTGILLPAKGGGLYFLSVESMFEVLKSLEPALPVHLQDLEGLLSPGTTFTIS